MAFYNRYLFGDPDAPEWFQMIDWDLTARPTATTFTLRNLDGSATIATGFGLTYDAQNQPTGGTITSLQHIVDVGGVDEVAAEVTGLSLSVTSFAAILSSSLVSGF